MIPELGHRASNASTEAQNRAQSNSDAQSRRADRKKVDKEEHLDTYQKAGAVTDSIEEQIRQQEEKIKEINENLALLRDDFNDKSEAKREAIIKRYQKELAQKDAEAETNSIQRSFNKLLERCINGEKGGSIERRVDTTNISYLESKEQLEKAKEEFKNAQNEADEAIQNYHTSNANFTGGIWKKEDAIWDLARKKRDLLFLLEL